MRSFRKDAFHFLKETGLRWKKDEAPRMAAALSYYTAFSLAPLLIIVVAVAGLVFGREAVEGRLIDQLGGLVGMESAKTIQSMIAASWQPAKGIMATLISVITLLCGATGVLSELKSALNRIWRTREGGGLSRIVMERAKFLGMILGIGFLMMVSLAMSAAISALGKFLGNALPFPEMILHVIDWTFSTAVITALFALLFKYLPDLHIVWRDVWPGAFVTAVLFTIGKSVLGLYLGGGAVGSTYGAAGSVLIMLLWVYYSALILYFGAELTTVYAEHYGSKLGWRLKSK